MRRKETFEVDVSGLSERQQRFLERAMTDWIRAFRDLEYLEQLKLESFGIYGSARCPKHHRDYVETARIAYKIRKRYPRSAIFTGAGEGLMGAADLGASVADGDFIGSKQCLPKILVGHADRFGGGRDLFCPVVKDRYGKTLDRSSKITVARFW